MAKPRILALHHLAKCSAHPIHTLKLGHQAAIALLFFGITGIKVLDTTFSILLGVLAIPAGTRAFTECRYWLLSRGNAQRFAGQEPITLPYTIPWVGGFTRMLSPHDCYHYAL
jgi:hypothetical protein